jgi:hypothetical protein
MGLEDLPRVSAETQVRAIGIRSRLEHGAIAGDSPVGNTSTSAR